MFVGTGAGVDAERGKVVARALAVDGRVAGAAAGARATTAVASDDATPSSGPAATRETRAIVTGDDRVMPAFSSGQWAGTVPATWAAIGNDDLLFMSGGGILAHPQGPAAGVTSIRQAWAAARAGTPLAEAARGAPELASALAFFDGR